MLIFVFISAFAVVGKAWLEKYGIDQAVLIVGNLLLFLVIFVAYFITYRSLSSANPQAFVRAMYAGFMIKFFLIALTAFIYIIVAKKEVNKPALLICGALYVIYTAIEIKSLLKLLKQQKNA